MRKLMWFTMGYAVSCAVGTYLLRGSGMLLMALGWGAAATALWLLRKNPARMRALALALGCVAGSLAFYGYERVVLRPAAELDGQTVPIMVQATDYSWETEYGCAADGLMDLNGRAYKIRFYIHEPQMLEPGDVVTMQAELRLTDEGGSREPTFHRTSGVLLLGYQRGEDLDIAPGEPTWRELPQLWALRLKRIIGAYFDPDVSGFAKALLLGDKSGLSWAQSTDFSLSGISHIVAVSGLHVSILFAFINIVAGKRRFLTAMIGIPVLLFFGAMAGFTASVTRAVIMQMLLLAALVLNREYDPPTALAAACLVMLGMCPLTIAGVGFQLSVASVAGIFMGYEPLLRWIKGFLPGTRKGFRGAAERWIASSAAVTLSATVLTVPLTAAHFGTVSLVGVATNLLVLPVVSLCFFGVMAVCAAGCLHGAAGAVLGKLAAWPMRYVMAVARGLGGMPLAAVYTDSPYIVIWLVFAYGLLGWLLLSRRRRLALALGLGTLGLCVSLMLSFLEPIACDYRVTVLDVGQGQCIVLQSQGSTFLVDCGGRRGEAAADIAAAHLLSQGINRIDGLILTHYDRDHAEGVQYLTRRIGVERVYLPGTEDTDGCLQSVLESVQERIEIDSELAIAFGGAQIRVFPAKDAGSGNDSCASVLFQWEKCDTLITGDLSADAERQLLKDYALPDLEVLIVGHHGSKYSTCRELLEATAPDAAIISVGAENGYGHPTQEVLERLEAAGCAVYRTDLHGTITYRG